jgi:hypothetical protein
LISSTMNCSSGRAPPLPVAAATATSSIGQPSTAIAPRWNDCSMSARVRTPDWMCGIVRVAPPGGGVPSRRSSAKSTIE